MSKKPVHQFFIKLQSFTEFLLTRRRTIQRIKREKQRAKNPLLDWIGAFIWAAGVVLLVNQYLFQAFRIPSGSMIDTLLERDRIFVNKLIYGPELLPGLWKLPSPIKPERNDVIIFESPDYFSKGPAFDIAQRIIYMLTLSLVDINRDEAGNPPVHFLIKRAAGMGGDHIEIKRGDLYFRFAGEDRWISEGDYLAENSFAHRITRIIPEDQYPAMEAIGRIEGYMELGLDPPSELVEKASAYGLYHVDIVTKSAERLALIRSAFPQVNRYRTQIFRQQSIYVPEGRILALGDNRDNSHDGRFFGTVPSSKILGQGAFKYWPYWRIGGIR